MPKFDFIIQNPPYNKTLHIDFFNKGLDLLPGKSNLPFELRRKAGDCSRVTAGPIDLI